MANWTDIPDANLAPGAPARSADAIALRDNITAQAEGAAGAPKTQTAAIQNESITVEKMARYTGATSRLIWKSALSSSVTGLNVGKDVVFFSMCQGGVYQFQIDVDSDGDKRTEVYVDGSRAFVIDDLAGPITRSTTLTLAQGSEVVVRLSKINQSGTATINGCRVYHEKVVPINGSC